MQKNLKHNRGLALKTKVTASSYRGNTANYAASNVIDGDKNTYWTTDDAVTTGLIEVDLGKVQTVKYVTLKEHIQLGQRIKAFTVEAWQNGQWQKVANATTIGYKRILKITPTNTQKIRINITESKACPVISEVEVY